MNEFALKANIQREQFRRDAAREFTAAILRTNEIGVIGAAQDGVKGADALLRALDYNKINEDES